jgi:dTDP-4-dehydrorhamnose 3,5-epimerase
MSDTAEVLYKVTDYYAPAHERCIRWDDPQLQIDWTQTSDQQFIISGKDRQGKLLSEAEIFS